MSLGDRRIHIFDERIGLFSPIEIAISKRNPDITRVQTLLTVGHLRLA